MDRRSTGDLRAAAVFCVTLSWGVRVLPYAFVQTHRVSGTRRGTLTSAVDSGGLWWGDPGRRSGPPEAV